MTLQASIYAEFPLTFASHPVSATAAGRGSPEGYPSGTKGTKEEDWGRATAKGPNESRASGSGRSSKQVRRSSFISSDRGLSPVTAVPAISSIRMIPVTRRPATPAPRPGPIAIMPVITAAIPHPVAIDPDIAIAGRCRPGVDHVGWLVGHIAVHCTARNSKTAGYSDDK